MNKAILICALLVVILAYVQAQKPPGNPNPKCLLIKCVDNSKRLLCARSKKNNCRLLTACQISRLNCQRGPLNSLVSVDSRRCRGIKPGRIHKCRDIHRKK